MNGCFVNFVVVFCSFVFFETPLFLSKWPSGLSLLSLRQTALLSKGRKEAYTAYRIMDLPLPFTEEFTIFWLGQERETGLVQF